MIQNVGKVDRIVRIIAGLALLSLPMFAASSWKWLAGLCKSSVGRALFTQPSCRSNAAAGCEASISAG
jgi:hypothetical protein